MVKERLRPRSPFACPANSMLKCFRYAWRRLHKAESMMFRIADVPRAMVAMSLWCLASSAFAAENDTWSVSKSSGEVWVTATSADPVSLKQEDVLKPGDTIRTGRSGRVLLVRGEETILIAPNSVIGLPAEKKDGLSTTILQQAGSILLD